MIGNLIELIRKYGGVGPRAGAQKRFIPRHYEKKHTLKHRGVKMAEYKGIEYLRNKLNVKRIRVQERYMYYEMKKVRLDPSPLIPQELKESYKSVLGWCGKAVDSLADRLVFREFVEDNFDLNQIFRMNNPDVFFDSAILSALISSCCFVYISADKDGYPRLQVIDGSEATGEIDPITGLLTEGYAVLKRDKDKKPVLEAYFIAGKTTYYQSGLKPYTVKTKVAYPTLVPIIFRPDAKRPFGHSRISRACMNIMDKARDTVTRTDVSAEFYSFPQKYVLGTSPDADPLDRWKATMTAMLEITKDDEGERPVAGSFPQASMEPNIAQLKMYASLFAGETGLTLDDLGFATENPSSAEAIKAGHETLRLTARKAQRTFGSGFLNVGFVAACMRDQYTYMRKQLYLSKPAWEPIFEPDFSAFSAVGDGIQKLSSAAPGYLGTDNLQDMLGIAPSKNPFPTQEGI